MRLILVLVISGTLVGPVAASTTRFFLKKGTTLIEARRYFENGFNRQSAITDTWSHDSPLRCRAK